MQRKDFGEWLASLPGAPTPSLAAKAAKLNHSSLLNHVNRRYTTAENAIAIARAYGVAPADALVEMGFLNADEVGASESLAVREALKRADWEDIFAEITARVNASEMFEGTFELSLDTPVEIPEPADLAAKRKAKEAGATVHKGENWRENEKPERAHVADTTPPEPGPGMMATTTGRKGDGYEHTGPDRHLHHRGRQGARSSSA
ncbi:hypothetical protein [Corynebacterium renale]|uniref:hypothetical protein n=1 Tax=Corynebacterium renale TaxID=1724 RepID=UPI00128B716C|nr:hypothetical protein [Corynebacterium renale]